MKYCSHCAQPVALKVPAGDNLPRFVCDGCGSVHYQNPKIVAGCIACWEERILLCRRAIQPRYGLWTVPAGFMENGETVAQAAARETIEEACAEVEDLRLHGLFNIPHISQLYIMFHARLAAPRFSAGAESLEVRLVLEEEVPWDELAFPVVRRSLRLFFSDRTRGRYETHMLDILPNPMPPS